MEIVENGEDRMDLHGFAGFNPHSGACYREDPGQLGSVKCLLCAVLLLAVQEKGALGTWKSGEGLEEVKRYIH